VPKKNEVIEKLYLSKEFNDCINKMQPEYLREDLKSEVILILLNTPDEKFNTIIDIRFYAVKIIIRLIQSSTSPFFKMYRRQYYPLDSQGNKEDKGAKAPPVVFGVDIDERLQRELQEERVKAYIKTIYWYDQEIINLYMKLGNYRAIEKETGIPWESCYSTVRKVIKKIRENVLTPQPV
jgi:hypothetical protein